MQDRFDRMQQRVAENPLASSGTDPELADSKQRRIIEEASAVLFEKGFHGTSIRDIASACGMSMGQLYHYISSKDDILYLMHKHSQELWYQRLSEAGFDDITNPVERLAYALRLSLEFIDEHRDLYLFIFTESKYLDREHLRVVLELDDKNVVGFYRGLLADIPGLPLTADEAETASNLIEFISVFLALRGWNLDRSKTAEHIDFLMAFLFRGLGLALSRTERGARS